MQSRTQDAAGKKSLAEARRRFERWRRSCRGYGRIPQELWQLAAETAAVHGADVTASQLQLDVKRLKDWMHSLGYPENSAGAPQFVELPPLMGGSTPECTLEWEDASGHKLRISLKGQATAHALELGQMLRRGLS